jgi:hypothetical protein
VARIQGSLGRAAPGFYDAPTGPNTKDEWTQPLTWANGTWRSKSFALAGGRSLGPTATKFFCTAVGGASTALILVATHPSASLAVVLVALALLLWLARLFLQVGVIFAVLGILVGALQYLVFRLGPLSELVDAFGRSNGLTETVVLGFGGLLNLLGLVVAQSACALALFELDGSGHASAAGVYRATLRRLAPLLGGLLVLVVVNAVLTSPSSACRSRSG